MARINNLTNFLTDVATAIKTKTGDSTAIPASQFDTKIANITTGHLDNTEYTDANNDLDDILQNTVVPSGTLSITANGEYDVTNYIGANVNVDASPSEYLDTTISAGTNNYSGASVMIKTIPASTKISSNSMIRMFRNCRGLLSVPLLTTSSSGINIEYMDYCFQGCINLEDVPIFNTTHLKTMVGCYQSCQSLTDTSLNNILKMCIDSTPTYIGNKGLNTIGLDSEQIAKCHTLSNYQDFINAGWGD